MAVGFTHGTGDFDSPSFYASDGNLQGDFDLPEQQHQGKYDSILVIAIFFIGIVWFAAANSGRCKPWRSIFIEIAQLA